MDNFNQVLELLINELQGDGSASVSPKIPVGISNRHVHLSQAELDALFGKNYTFNKLKDLSQPKQFACKEVVTLCGPKGVIEKVRILGPVRPQTQVEILASDCFKLGVKAPVRLSGHLNDTPGITLVGPEGSVQLAQGVIIAQRHIHILPKEAEQLGLHDGQNVSIKVEGLRKGTLDNVIIRATEDSALECHIDTEEANALGITSSTKLTVIK